MSDSKANIVPFGKYKGRLIEEVIESDPAYLQWLSSQEWFRSRFGVLYQVIINRGAEPEETPEHNALQVRFLDDDFCVRFMRCVVPDCDATVRQILNKCREARLLSITQDIKEKEKRLQNKVAAMERQSEVSDCDWWVKQMKQDHQKLCEELEQLRHQQVLFVVPMDGIDFEIINRVFEERGIDVAFTANACVKPYSDFDHSIRWFRNLAIEVKPAIGDDYPAVPRQMKANRSQYLFVGQYTGRGASREQFIKTFATASIQVVFADQVPDA